MVQKTIQTSLDFLRCDELPQRLCIELQHLRQRHLRLLQQAEQGDFTHTRALRALSRRLGRLLATEARRGPAERGCSMLTLSLAIDRLFPELRAMNNLYVHTLLSRRLTQPRRPGKAG